MKIINNEYKTTYQLSNSEVAKLIKIAEDAKINSYPPKASGFSVALMTKAGHAYEGVSYKSDTGTLTMHSEMVALAHAAIHGETEVIAITGPNCHICKQLIYESSLRSGIDTVIIIEEDGEFKQVPISSMMPYAWPSKAKDIL